ncbi:RIP metalloprotease RseP [Zhouia spongiae]|uniref:Zinc metalloprotease n=1 Tax=Zhouia spongiae TaxID=2202721 RepID=A0ABY3YMB3_9FLAO|nr:RIP metalloprotease RseP [Zhouia spongiae]UNY98298.1 RIP metalloprotease RseP [Zhouia spongiae]
MIMILQLILGLGLLVFLHELGHFLFARLFGMRVEKFVIFMDLFDVKLFKFKKGETEYSMGWLPIGGYVKISGMVDESMDTEHMSQEPKPWEFRYFPAWKRIIVLLGGIIVNLITGLVIYWGILYFGEKNYLPNNNVTEGIYAYEPGESLGFQNGDIISKVNDKKVKRFKDAYPNNLFNSNKIEVIRDGSTQTIITPPVFENMRSKNSLLFSNANHKFTIDSIVENSPAYNVGLKKGDVITTINNHEVSVFGDIRNILLFKSNNKDSLKISIDRNGEKLNLSTLFDYSSVLGIVSYSHYTTKKYGILEALYYGYKTSIDMLDKNLAGFKAIFANKIEVTKSVTGPIGIAKIYGDEFSAMKFWQITALISLVLAITNLLPIPALDGGQILIIMIESIIGKELPDRIKTSIQITGLVIIFGLLIFTTINDIINF